MKQENNLDKNQFLMDEPSPETLVQWIKDGYCLATDGCIVLIDGTCKHNCRSWWLEKEGK